MSPPPPPSVIVESLKIADPRRYGAASKSPLLTKKARALAVRSTIEAYDELDLLLTKYLHNRDDGALLEALTACPDSVSYSILFGVLARAACRWTSYNDQMEEDSHWLFGIPVTLHSHCPQMAESWAPREFGPDTNSRSLEDLKSILKRTGVTRGMRDLTIIPH